MEHRWSTRVDTDISVLIYRDTLPIAKCKAENISLDGVFIRTGSLRFAQKSSVEVEIEPSGYPSTRRQRLPALVVHCSPGGTGLMFERLTPSSERMLQSLIQASNSSEITNTAEG